MVDELEGSKKDTLEGSPNDQTWVTFEEPDEETKANDSSSKGKSSSGSGQYLSQLERELQRLQDKRRKPLSSKEIIRTLQEAKDSHMKQLMDSSNVAETFIMDGSGTKEGSCCYPLYRTVFPKQPLSKEELECLVEDDENSDE